MRRLLAIKKLLVFLTIVMLVQVVLVSVAHAAVKYSDWRWSTTDIFVRNGGSDWTQVSTGGYNNQNTYWKSYPANGWTYAKLHGENEWGFWKLPSAANFYWSEWQVYITSSGTDTRAHYDAYSKYRILNQYTVHGWVSLLTNGYYYNGVELSDHHDGYNWWSGQKAAFDAIRIYY